MPLLKTKMNSWRTPDGALIKQYNELMLDLKQINLELGNLKSDKTMLASKVTELEALVATLTTERTTLQDQLKAFNEKPEYLAELKAQVDLLSKEKNDLAEKLKVSTESANTLEAQVKDFDKKLDDLAAKKMAELMASAVVPAVSVSQKSERVVTSKDGSVRVG